MAFCPKPGSVFVFDLDGTVYLGDAAIPGAVQFINSLIQKGYGVILFSNNSSRSVSEVQKKLSRMGLEATAEQIVLSSHVAAAALQKLQPGKRCYALANPNLELILREQNIALTDDPKCADYVLLGFDTTLTYRKLQDAAMLLDSGKPYYATHPDINCPTADGFMPDTGAMIALLEVSTGRKPDLVFGKPELSTVEFICAKTDQPKECLIFIGDRLETDIAIGRNGVQTILVYTGITTPEIYAGSSIQADLAVQTLADITL
ncbi:MAG: HAD-IIA family hydrolase [Oscillospiraceae bacterium]|jgi:NagD protein|nr:HAD-IIA family hydrolase [Oscillospiraceae bacterium]